MQQNNAEKELSSFLVQWDIGCVSSETVYAMNLGKSVNQERNMGWKLLCWLECQNSCGTIVLVDALDIQVGNKT